jgi:quinol monooxygenase YgiN
MIMSLIPLASKGNFFHIYDFRVKPGTGETFLREFEEFDYSDVNPMHKSPAQVKDGVMLRDTTDPDHFFLIGEWSDIEVHAEILKEMVKMNLSFIDHIEDLDKGAFKPVYAEVVSSTPQHILDEAAE